MVSGEHTVGLRELRQNTRAVLARVQHGETLDVTEYGRALARIVPIEARAHTPIMTRLVESGRATLATRPGFRPRMRAGDGSDALAGALADIRGEERY